VWKVSWETFCALPIFMCSKNMCPNMRLFVTFVTFLTYGMLCSMQRGDSLVCHRTFFYIKWEGVEGLVRNFLRSPYFYVSKMAHSYKLLQIKYTKWVHYEWNGFTRCLSDACQNCIGCTYLPYLSTWRLQSGLPDACHNYIYKMGSLLMKWVHYLWNGFTTNEMGSLRKKYIKWVH
jgi:hypothetical protein